jgi:hypothetical protein
MCEEEPNTENTHHIPDAYKDETFYEKAVNVYCFYKQVTASEKEGTFKYDWEKYDFEKDGIDSRDFWYKISPNYSDSAAINNIRCMFVQREGIDPVSGI